MLKATRSQRTLAHVAEVRGVGFFYGADVTVRFCPAKADTGIVFIRSDLPDHPRVPARIENVTPMERRTAIQRGAATVEMIEHVMAALAGLQIDNCIVEIDAPECPGCDGSSRVFVEALDRAGTVPQDARRKAFVIDRSFSLHEGDAFLAAHPSGTEHLTLSYHLDYGDGAPIAAQSFCIGLSPASFRRELAASRTFLLEAEANALRAAGLGSGATPRDLLIFRSGVVVGNELRFSDECVRHKILDMVGDLALLGVDLHGFVVGHRSGHKANAALARRLAEYAGQPSAQGSEPVPQRRDGTLDVEGITSLLPHRYPFLLVDRVLELEPPRRVVAVKNVSANEPYFAGHWPGLRIMPGVLIIEAMAQAAGVLIAASVSRAGRVALITSIDDVKLRRPVVPGDQLRVEVAGQRIKHNAAYVSGLAKVGDNMVAEAKLRFIIVVAKRTPSSPDRDAFDQAVESHVVS
jgi:UDP-3-O-[3-hydroxymyristoyl] N-acetylglucosamine deacetylase/3-hydroxyacyl-[acyl-carrier-protein] dehydratase